MALTSEDIREKTFETRFRGYDTEEVDVFLEEIMAELEPLQDKVRSQEQHIKDLEDKLNYFDEMKESLSQSVLVAQETADRVKQKAHEEAQEELDRIRQEATVVQAQAQEESERVLREAHKQAEEMLNKASTNAQDILKETEGLRQQSQTFQSRMIAALQEQLRLAQSAEWEELLHPKLADQAVPDQAEADSQGLAMDDGLTSAESEVAYVEPSSGYPDAYQSEDNDAFDDQLAADATRQFSPEEMMDLQRRIDESNRILEETQNLQADIEEAQRILADQGLLETAEHPTVTDESQDSSEENLGETKTFKLF